MTNLEKFKEVFGEDVYIKMRGMDKWCCSEYEEPVKENQMYEFVKWLDGIWDSYRVYPDLIYIFNKEYTASIKLSDFENGTAYMRMDGVCKDVSIDHIKKILMEFKQKEVEKSCSNCKHQSKPEYHTPCNACFDHCEWEESEI